MYTITSCGYVIYLMSIEQLSSYTHITYKYTLYCVIILPYSPVRN